MSGGPPASSPGLVVTTESKIWRVISAKAKVTGLIATKTKVTTTALSRDSFCFSLVQLTHPVLQQAGQKRKEARAAKDPLNISLEGIRSAVDDCSEVLGKHKGNDDSIIKRMDRLEEQVRKF